jgi:ABC-type multidrug transport system ATPase subunit
MGVDNLSAGLTIKNVTKRLEKKTVLNDVSFTAKPAEILALVGSSGSGKTTLLKTLNRLIEIDAGEILLNSRSILTMDPIELRRCVSFVSQIPTMFEGTVKQNIEFGLKLQSGFKVEDQKVNQALMDAGLNPKFLNRTANKLSVGEQQRVALARALVLEPEVLLLDEPTAALDPKLTRKIEETITKLCRTRKLVILWISHDHAQARRIGTKLGILKKGKIKVLENLKPPTTKSRKYKRGGAS